MRASAFSNKSKLVLSCFGLLALYALISPGNPKKGESNAKCVPPGTNLIRNPNFEHWDGGTAVGWQFFDKGYMRASDQKHNGNFSIQIPGNIDRDHSGKLLHHRGATQYILLNQKTAEPLTLAAWSRPEGVEVNVYDNGEPVPDVRYVLSIDIRYTDGTHEDETMLKFEFDIPDWHRQCLIVDPAKPIFSVTVGLLFFGHIGSVWFDEVGLWHGDTAPASVNLASTGSENRCWRHRVGLPHFSSFKQLPHFVVGAQQTGTGDTTIVTQLSMDRLHILRDMALMWEGPISAAVYTPCTLGCHPDKTSILTKLRHPKVQQWVTLHLVMSRGDRYPVNVLRNVALRHSNTKHVLLLDVDFLPSHDMRTALASRYQRNGMTVDSRQVWIAPAFEFLKPIGEDLSQFPKDKAELVALLEQPDLIQPVHQFYKPAHSATDYKRWYNATQPYTVKYELYFEPYIISHIHIPEYDERFIGYGNDKASHLYELDKAGYNFVVLPDVFIIHMYHEAPAWRSSSNREQVHVWRTWYNFVNDIQYRYNSSSMYSVCPQRAGANAAASEHSGRGSGVLPFPLEWLVIAALLLLLARQYRHTAAKSQSNFAV